MGSSRQDAKTAKGLHRARRRFSLRPWRLGVIILPAICLAAIAWAGADSERYLRDVRQLAAPEMKGRGAGSPELEKAAQYMARQFQAAGLQPLNGGSYLQPL